MQHIPNNTSPTIERASTQLTALFFQWRRVIHKQGYISLVSFHPFVSPPPPTLLYAPRALFNRLLSWRTARNVCPANKASNLRQ